MGTKIQGNAFLRDYHSVIDLDGGTTRGASQLLKNDSFVLHDQEQVRRTILEHESIFRYQVQMRSSEEIILWSCCVLILSWCSIFQLQELHRLYGRQRELMNEIRSREMNKDGVKDEKCWLFSSNLLEDARRTRDPFHSSSSRSMAGCLGTRFSKVPVFESSVEKRNHQGSYDTDNRFSFINGVKMSQHRSDALTFDFKRKGISVSNTPGLSSGEISTNLCSNVDLATKDFFPSSVDRMNEGKSPGILGLGNGRRGKEQLFDDYAGMLIKHLCFHFSRFYSVF